VATRSIEKSIKILFKSIIPCSSRLIAPSEKYLIVAAFISLAELGEGKKYGWSYFFGMGGDV
jgi:hypothetical protein